MKLRTAISASVAALALLAGPLSAQDHAGHADHSAHSAEEHAAHMAAEATALPSGPEGPALWKVADEDTTIYLFGTVHVLPADLEWYDAEIDEALQASDTIVTELKMDPQSEAAMQQLAMREGMFTDGTTLRTLLTDEQKAAYEAAVATIGAPPEAFDPFEPWMAGLTLTMVPVLQAGYDPNSGVDKVIISKAGDRTQEALETAEFQLGIFDSLPQDKQVEFLMEAVEAMPRAKEVLDSMVAEWAEGDAEELAEVMNENMSDPALAEALLYARNAAWAEWIDTRLDSTPGTVFVAVGAGHLAGEKSVQDYLAERDIETTRVQ